MRLKEFAKTNALLLRFLFIDGLILLKEITSAWDNAEETPSGSSGLPIRRYTFDRRIIDGYNERYDRLRRIPKVFSGRRHYSRLLGALLAIRVVSVVTSAVSGFVVTFTVSLLQFIVAPFSFFAAVAAWISTLPQFVVHYILFGVLQGLTGILFIAYPSLASFFLVTISPAVILGWVLVDQAVCAILCVWTPIGSPIRYSGRRILESAVVGFINGKTYWLVLLFLLQGFKVNLLAALLALMLPARLLDHSASLLRPVLPTLRRLSTYMGVMFYHYHRMVHLPLVYDHAHRPHHYLQDATPFDADMYGSGFPEEWLRLMTEITISLATGLMPFSLGPHTIFSSLANKLGHTRIEGTRPVGDNFHVNHHTAHIKNFGYSFFPMDLLMGTEHGDVSSLGNLPQTRVVCTKKGEPTRYILEVRPVVEFLTAGTRQESS